jgi:hypothetical protein
MAYPLNLVRAAIPTASLVTTFLAGLPQAAQARGGGHGFAGGFSAHGRHGPQFAGGHRHGNDEYVKAASDERDRLLTAKIKSICRGC